jgi:hypothetical protein
MFFLRKTQRRSHVCLQVLDLINWVNTQTLFLKKISYEKIIINRIMLSFWLQIRSQDHAIPRNKRYHI